ncbi:MAG: dihydropteroate synthase [Acidimicrobiia bacterium]|nr:MAG: dihydropteroate synthase [Acidimicrobiia bacterium]
MAVPEQVPGSGTWKLRDSQISLLRPVVMGILNVTPDSFSDGGRYPTLDSAVECGRQMAADGASIVDVGGESTRPGAAAVSVNEELERVAPIVERLATDGITVSVDTSKPEVARAVVCSGAAIINDVTGLGNPAMRSVCAETGVGVVIMHMQGIPRTMQHQPHYADVVAEVSAYLTEHAEAAVRSGISRGSVIIDPGIGFGKAFDHNLELMANLDAFVETGYPVLLGTSRKAFLGKILEPIRGRTAPDERDGATAASIALAVAAGVKILRVHNVPLAVEVAHTVKAMVPGDDGEETNRA